MSSTLKAWLLFKRLGRGLIHTLTLLLALPSPPKRRLLRRMIAMTRQLPGLFDQPLPAMMAQLTPLALAYSTVHPDAVRALADAVAAWHHRSPLGICLRRSLLRYYFLREAGVPVTIIFGARLKQSAEGGGLGGHAWLTLHGQPYHENPHDYEGFTVMVVYPEGERQFGTTQ